MAAVAFLKKTREKKGGARGSHPHVPMRPCARVPTKWAIPVALAPKHAPQGAFNAPILGSPEERAFLELYVLVWWKWRGLGVTRGVWGGSGIHSSKRGVGRQLQKMVP